MNTATVQYIKHLDRFRIRVGKLDVYRKLQWCKEKLDVYTGIKTDWDVVKDNPNQVFTI